MPRLLIIRFALLGSLVCLSFASALAEEPKLLIWDAEYMERIRDGWRDDAGVVERSLAALRKRAKSAMKTPLQSVVDHGEIPPSGDRHDYMSFGPYWWPNPDTPDGLPFVRRDGVTNRKQHATGDSVPRGQMLEAVETLSTAAYLLENKRFAARAAKHLRHFYFGETTRMNPNLNHGQAIPGRTDGRGIGIIDTRRFAMVPEFAKLLQMSDAWTDEDDAKLKSWMGDYLEWLVDSPLGRDEQRTRNNHGTHYDVQVVGLALYVGQRDLARRVLEESRELRFLAHIEPDGSQPHELDRTKSLTYSLFNLSGLCLLARYGDEMDIDLWNLNDDGRGSVRAAAHFLVPALLGDKPWPFEQIEPIGRKGKPVHNQSGLWLLAQRWESNQYLRPMRNDNGKFSKSSLSPLYYQVAVMEDTSE